MLSINRGLVAASGRASLPLFARLNSEQVIVDCLSTNRRTLPWVIFAFMALALSVFSWGLGYKLSLYDPPQSSSHQIPQAKLLSRDQEAATVEVLLASGTENSVRTIHALLASVFFCSFLAFIPLDTPVLGQRERDIKQVWRLRYRAALTFFSVLPPPAVA